MCLDRTQQDLQKSQHACQTVRKDFQVPVDRSLTVSDMVLQAFPDLEAQSTNVFSHIQKRVLRLVPVLTSPLGSRRDNM